jgi:nickel-dependent lactate racemase
MNASPGQTLMQAAIEIGQERLTLDVPSDRLVRLERAEWPAPVPNPAEAIREALEHPVRYPALRQALTPDDHVTIVVDEHLPRLSEMVTAVIEHIVGAGVNPAAITLVCPPTASKQPWIEALPDAFQEVRLEVHDPADRKRLAYLATTKSGQRVYLNRAAVEADQLVVLTAPHFDALHGYAGAEAALYPALGDVETREHWQGKLSMDPPGEVARAVRREATEVSWLLGAPFYVQVIEGTGDEVLQVVSGSADSAAEGRHWLDRCWRAVAAEPADLVIATITGDPARHDIGDIARALACASRVVRPDGVIALLCGVTPQLGEGFQQMLRIDEANEARRTLKNAPPPDWPACYQWLKAVRKAHVYLLSGLPTETAEGLFSTPIQHARQVQRLIDAGGSCLILPDAHKLLAVTA